MSQLDAYRLNVDTYQMTFWERDLLEPHLESLDVPFLALQALYQVGVLSFEPRRGMSLSPQHRAELHFLAPLVRMQLDAETILHLLRSLKPPYNYDHQLIYLDWRSLRWRPYPTIDLVKTVSTLKLQAWEAQDIKGLNSMEQQLNSVLEDIKLSIVEIQSSSKNTE